MSTNRYLEFDSTYRNREMYPNPANFVVELSQSGQADAKNAKDPVSFASPILSWNNSFQETAESNTTVALTVDTSFAPTDPTILKITCATGGIRYLDDFYNGAVLRITVATVSTLRRIVDYEYLGVAGGVENAIITLDSALPGGAISTDGVIENPTPIPTDTSDAVIKFFIPGSEAITNFYSNYYIQLVSGPGLTGEYRTIEYFDPVTHLATLSAPTTEDWSASASGDANFVIRKALVESTGALVDASSRVLQLASSASTEIGYYVGSFVRMISPVPTNTGFSTEVAPYNEESRIVKYLTGDGTITALTTGSGSTPGTFTLSVSASNNDYTGCILTDVTTGDDRVIATYNVSTRSGTIVGVWSGGAIAGDTWTIRSAFVAEPFTANASAGQNYEIEKFSRDNAVPFEYKGSMVSVQQEVCYEVELVNLILPNRALISGRGGRPVFYPFLYVELEQVSAAGKGSQEGMLYSNNPNARKMMFRAVLDDTTQPVVSPFIRIDSDGQVATVKFKPNDSFKFVIYDPHGNVFETALQDYYSPTEPNPLVQINALFSFRKL